MSKRRRPLVGDLCLGALAATAGALAVPLGREYSENPYVRAGIDFPDWVFPAALLAGAAAWMLGSAIHLAGRRRLPLKTFLPTQFALGLVAGLAASFATQ